MKNLLALGAAALLGFIVVGWYLGWYHIQSVPTPTGHEYKVDFNTPKITEDLNKGKVKLEGVLTKQPTTNSPAPAPAPTPPNAPPRITIVPVTTQDGTFVLPGNPETPVIPAGPQLLPPLQTVPPPLPPR